MRKPNIKPGCKNPRTNPIPHKASDLWISGEERPGDGVQICFLNLCLPLSSLAKMEWGLDALERDTPKYDASVCCASWMRARASSTSCYLCGTLIRPCWSKKGQPGSGRPSSQPASVTYLLATFLITSTERQQQQLEGGKDSGLRLGKSMLVGNSGQKLEAAGHMCLEPGGKIQGLRHKMVPPISAKPPQKLPYRQASCGVSTVIGNQD